MHASISRRSMIITGTLGLAATLATLPAEARPLNDTENANIKLMKDFFASWDKPNLDLEKVLAQYMAPTVAVRWSDDAPFAHGLEAAVNTLKPSMPAGTRVTIQIHRIFACGPLVATSRLDTIKTPGKPDSLFEAAGVHIVKDGKIQEYTDYLVS